jgi:hypothetical protein
MTPEGWQRLKEVFLAALGRKEEERGSFLEEVCRGDEDLCREVRSLLASHEEAGRFLEEPAASRAAARPRQATPPRAG